MATIIKKENGSVVFQAIKGQYQNRQFVGASISLQANGTTFDIREFGQLVFSFEFSEVQYTQIEPSAAIDAPATSAALLTLLQEDFFYKPATASPLPPELLFENATAQSTGAGAVLLYTVPVPNDNYVDLEASIVGKLSGSAQYYSNKYTARLFASGGAVTVVTAASSIQENFTNNPAITFAAVGNTYLIRVSSVSVQTIDWQTVVKTTTFAF